LLCFGHVWDRFAGHCGRLRYNSIDVLVLWKLGSSIEIDDHY
jgi:hypothetical protein